MELTTEEKEKLMAWAFGDDTGVSSETMAKIALGLGPGRTFGFDRPYDSGDFGRCYRLVKVVPELREFFPLIVEKCPQFGPIIEHWDELCALYEQDLSETPQYEMRSRGRGRSKIRVQINQRACYDRMRELNDLCYLAGGWTKTDFGWTRDNA